MTADPAAVLAGERAWAVVQGDCLQAMPSLPNGSVDMVLADLPYGTTAHPWDSPINLDALWVQYRRLIKPYGAVVLTASQPFTTALIVSNPDWFKYEWIWEKNRPTNFAHAKNKPMKIHESILVFSGGTTVHASQSAERMPYYPQGVRHIAPVRRQTCANNTMFTPRKSHAAATWGTETNYPTSILRFDTDMLNLHPTAKPVELMAYLIRTYTNPGDVVLDNAAGSGTTGVAAIREGRRSILIEQDAHYCAVARKRLEDASAHVPLPFDDAEVSA